MWYHNREYERPADPQGVIMRRLFASAALAALLAMSSLAPASAREVEWCKPCKPQQARVQAQAAPPAGPHR